MNSFADRTTTTFSLSSVGLFERGKVAVFTTEMKLCVRHGSLNSVPTLSVMASRLLSVANVAMISIYSVFIVICVLHPVARDRQVVSALAVIHRLLDWLWVFINGRSPGVLKYKHAFPVHWFVFINVCIFLYLGLCVHKVD